MRIVLDTNVLVSALLTDHGAEATVLDLVIERRLIWCVSEDVLAEYAEVLRRPKFRHVEPARIHLALALAGSGQVTQVSERIRHSPDESDNRFYECANAARADYLVTGNRKHFPKDLPPTKIVNARQLLAALEGEGR